MRPEILLKCFVEHRSDDAFRDLVSATLPMVYSTALRVCDRSVPLAQTACERVFLKLARHATSLNGKTALLSLLHREAYESANVALTEAERQPRPRVRVRIRSSADVNPQNLEAIAAVFDRAINGLRSADKEIVLAAIFEKGAQPPEPALKSLYRRLCWRGMRIELSLMKEILERDWTCQPPAGLKMRVTEGALLAAARPLGLWERFKPLWLKPAYGVAIVGVAVVATIVAIWPAHKAPAPLTPRLETRMTPLQWVNPGGPEQESPSRSASRTQQSGTTTPQAFGTQHETEPEP